MNRETQSSRLLIISPLGKDAPPAACATVAVAFGAGALGPARIKEFHDTCHVALPAQPALSSEITRFDAGDSPHLIGTDPVKNNPDLAHYPGPALGFASG